MMSPPFDNVNIRLRDRKYFSSITKNVNDFMLHSRTLTEDQLIKLIMWEVQGERRSSIINRARAKFNRLRNDRETQEMIDIMNSRD